MDLHIIAYNMYGWLNGLSYLNSLSLENYIFFLEHLLLHDNLST